MPPALPHQLYTRQGCGTSVSATSDWSEPNRNMLAPWSLVGRTHRNTGRNSVERGRTQCHNVAPSRNVSSNHRSDHRNKVEPRSDHLRRVPTRPTYLRCHPTLAIYFRLGPTFWFDLVRRLRSHQVFQKFRKPGTTWWLGSD